ncbi:MAG: PDZ domain-containing protein, partial [Actinobacteria bacterium]|nr:PDZ domain-containing protein [Actinomycetota bacterium]
APSGGKGGRLDISVNDTCLAPFPLTINLQDVGGPSAGLMFALGIIDKVGPYDLTKGQYIAGTGELDPSDPAKGTVEPIGGIALKMIAARNAGATVFLAPAGNCDTVRSATPSGLKVVKVSTVSDAVQDLLKLQRNEPVPSC